MDLLVPSRLILVSTCLHVVSAQVQYERISEYDDYFFQDFRIFTDKISTLDECLIMCSLNTDGCLSVSHIIEKDLNQQICIGYSVVFQMGSSAIYIDDTMYYAFSKGSCLHPYSLSASKKKCMKTSHIQMSWSDAKEHCHQDGGRLMNVEYENANNDIATYTNGAFSVTETLFLGGFMTGGIWQWDEGYGPLFTYTNWKPGQPIDAISKPCLKIILQGDFHWRTGNCSTESYFICERDMV